ncbi:TPA: aldo/keto reductase [Bacillus thuringiensis]|uniref:Aldo/keto reductase n=2 Tax=Bacillus cereus group TaxID=86661 RepID=A0A9X6KVA7_BACTU|nr:MULTISPECIES: aldo/keto reductase [Bacillus]AGE81006.1 YtbE (Aldo/keto reductase YtbE) [Bacillus thuringiensis serovar kurstaki str. HD73]AHZ53955.1 oxidoreductase, aldo/keto reductase [Bacillus thuringiensis serovar kurstaki str. YBT-1520]AIE36376.1 oxidoreductase, aldo/keto reductase [Bacillus thuringiensis serovar kurstaki str. HD-1]AIM29213.1 YtbE (Aldo/keto reductase YtbE) [Bacillus thuringiensis serovar kurstaki str. YBT-1520]AJA22313.1 glyoxal reductase [Bacillus thuringiensis serova
MKNLQSKTVLNNGVEMPWFGLGVFKVEDGPELVEAVKSAIKAGYRSIDTAAIYGNEKAVGEGIRAGIKEAGISREDLFITSKVWNSDQGYETTLAAYEESLKKLELDYLDLYLVHWPVEGKYKDTWRALETLYNEKRVRAIGVSNFQIHHLQDVMKDAEIKPMINQVEYHPRLTQKELQAFCKEQGIQMEAWSPLMQGQLLDNEKLQEIAEKHGKTTAQVILRWDLQNGVITIPKSTKEHRIIANADIFNFELTKEDMEKIDALNQNHRVGPDPDNFDF